MEAGEIFSALLGVVHEFGVGEFAGVGEHADVLVGLGEDEEAHGDVIVEHGLHKSVEEQLVFALQETFGLLGLLLVGVPLEVLVHEVLPGNRFVGLEDQQFAASVFDILVDILQNREEAAARFRVAFSHFLQRVQECQ